MIINRDSKAYKAGYSFGKQMKIGDCIDGGYIHEAIMQGYKITTEQAYFIVAVYDYFEKERNNFQPNIDDNWIVISFSVAPKEEQA